MHELNVEESRALLTVGEVAHLAVVSNGEPYITPISYVLLDRELCFRTGPGRRLDAIGDGARVCIEVSRTGNGAAHWESVIAWGQAEIVNDERFAEEVAIRLLEKYRPLIPSPLAFSWAPPGGLPDAVTVRVPLELITGRASSAGFGPEMRPGRF